MGEEEVKLQLFLISTLCGGDGRLHAPAGLPPGNNKHRRGNTAVKSETTDMRNDINS